jgi:hypothetical protein
MFSLLPWKDFVSTLINMMFANFNFNNFCYIISWLKCLYLHIHDINYLNFFERRRKINAIVISDDTSNTERRFSTFCICNVLYFVLASESSMGKKDKNPLSNSDFIITSPLRTVYEKYRDLRCFIGHYC